jgi:hypothetical protein
MKKNNMKLIVDLMDESIKKLSKLIEDSRHKMDCNNCGQEFDMRDLSQVFAHEKCNGMPIDLENIKKIPHSGAIRIGESILHTKNNGKINLN